MIKTLIAALAVLVSAQAMASGIDFAKVPKDQAVLCNGQDALADGLGVQFVYTPNKAFDGAKLNLGYLIFDQADQTNSEAFTAAVIGRKAIADKDALLAALKSQLGGLLDDAVLEQVAAQDAVYPMSLVVGKREVMPEGATEAVGNSFILSITGFKFTGSDGKDVEATFSALYFKPTAKSTEKAALWSAAYQGCNLVPLTDIFPPQTEAPAAPVTK